MAKYELKAIIHVDEEDPLFAEQMVEDILTVEHLYPQNIVLNKISKE